MLEFAQILPLVELMFKLFKLILPIISTACLVRWDDFFKNCSLHKIIAAAPSDVGLKISKISLFCFEIFSKLFHLWK